MPRQSKGARLYLRSGRNAGWVIRDGTTERRTGCGPDDRAGAERALQDYIARKYTPPTRESLLDRIACADVINVYLREHAPHTRSLNWIIHTATPIIEWWGNKTLAEIRGQTCRQYVDWRCAQGVSDQTARHDLKTFRAAINYYHREYGPLSAVPAVTMPRKGPAKARWLTRSEAAALLRAARSLGYEHVARAILIGIYTGTRSQALFGLRWLPSTDAGWIDLERGMLYRRGAGQHETAKRQPPVPIPRRLMPHLRRWHARDTGLSHVIHWRGQPIAKLRRSWSAVCELAGIEGVTPHTLRHTATTWLLQAGVPTWEVAGYVGMSEEVVRDVYGHHHPDHMLRAASAR